MKKNPWSLIDHSFLSVFFLILISGTIKSSTAQNLSAFVNIRNEFYVFEDSFTHQIDYLPPLSYKVGGNAIAFVDNKNTFKIYQYGALTAPIKGIVTDYAVSNELVFLRTPGSMYAFENGELNLLTRFAGPYVLGDSIIGFIDFASRNLYAYHDGIIKELKQGTTDPAGTFMAVGGNLFAYKSYDEVFCVFYHDSVYDQQTEFPVQVKAGNNVVAFLDQYEDGLRIFYKGQTKIVEEFNPRSFQVGNDLVAYVTHEGDFKIFWQGKVYTMGNYNLSKLQVKDNLVLYSDRLNYLHVFYNGKSYALENFIPSSINASQSTLFYYDQSNHLKIFSGGIEKEMPMDTYVTISNDYDVVKMQLQANQFRFFSNGRLY
jgi:hypothetical protein